MTMNPSYKPPCLALENVQCDNRLQDISFTVRSGQCVHVVGENGAGKTTLLLAMAGLLNNGTEGQIKLNNVDLRQYSLAQLATSRCFLSQQVSCQFDLTVAEILHFYTEVARIPAEIEDALELSPLLAQSLLQLSGGEQQRVHIARCLLQIWPAIQRGEGVLLLDEPLQSLDVAHQQCLLQLLSRLVAQGNVVVMSCHDVNTSYHHASHVALLLNGQMIASGQSKSVLTPNNLKTTLKCDFHLIYSENAYEFLLPVVNKP
ncbi:ATP-binding cassette domain-containing protein [Alteromonas oceanisediminis]|uniref:ATP-binding cassette domain-containing protein n=1 Tax=Alteromonas oceanisediminis TaxID=2836180 RepID=UPI001BDA2CF0|nr:ATP-binding cassette domain-containing protein [Alteromonas oceanisediminis]MBT0587636.1 ATP-binding cassette domain-containing protein [Alteromonas oceanisediminis]